MRVMIVFNPTAGQAGSLERQLAAATDVWRTHDWQVDLSPTNAPGDGTRLARVAAEQGYDIVVAAGGDGTINEVVNGLVGSDTALATLPLGTVNVWARELGLPLNPRTAAEAMLSWHIRAVDVGCANGRYFLLMAGIGFDAEVTAGVRAEEKQRFGAFAYVLYAFERALCIRGTRTRLVLDGKNIKGRVLLVVIGNSQLYGGILKITYRATMDDGLLDVCILKGNNLASGLFHTMTILQQRHSQDSAIEYYRARSIEVTSRPPLPVQVDGDTIGTTPMRFDVVPGALRALMPLKLPDNLVRDALIPPPPPQPYAIQRVVSWLAGVHQHLH